jgi:hypothetical protein
VQPRKPPAQFRYPVRAHASILVANWLAFQ